MLDQLEGDALREKAHELGTDRMSFADSMYARGLDPAQVHTLLERLRGVDSALPGDAAGEHRDHLQNPLAPASSLTPDEVKLWREAMATRYDELHSGYTTASGTAIPATPIEKIVDEKQANTLATGVYDDKGVGRPVSPTVGGYIGMASHSAGLGSAQRVQMAGLDSRVHAAAPYNYFDESTNQWTQDVAGPGGGIDKLEFPASPDVVSNAQVPLGSAAHQLVLSEGTRLASARPTTAAGVGEYIPRLFETTTGASGALSLNNVALEPRSVADGHTNPYTGWGFSATRRALDASGAPLPVLDNQELKLKKRVDIEPPANLSSVSPQGIETPLANFLRAPYGPAVPNIVTPDASRRQAMWDHADGLGRTASWPRP